MLDFAVCVILKPLGGAGNDVEFAVWIIGGAVAAGLVVGARSVYGAIVLSDVKVDGPRAELVDHRAIGCPKLFVGMVFFDKCMLGSVVAEKVEISVGEI